MTSENNFEIFSDHIINAAEAASRVFYKTGVLVFLNVSQNSQENTFVGVFSSEFYKIFKNNYFT